MPGGAVLGPGGGILQRRHDADAALMAGADEMQNVLAKSRLILGVSGVVEKNADLVEVEPPGVVHVALGLRRVVGQPVFRMANGGCGLVVEPAPPRKGAAQGAPQPKRLRYGVRTVAGRLRPARRPYCPPLNFGSTDGASMYTDQCQRLRNRIQDSKEKPDENDCGFIDGNDLLPHGWVRDGGETAPRLQLYQGGLLSGRLEEFTGHH